MSASEQTPTSGSVTIGSTRREFVATAGGCQAWQRLPTRSCIPRRTADMTYRFHSKAAADVFMLQPVGDRVLQAMGLAPAYRGIIQIDMMPAALAAVAAAIDDEEARATPGEGDRISLRQRAWPLMGMLRSALADRQTVIWSG